MLANDDFDSISAVPTLNAFSVYPHGMEAQGLLYTQKLEGILKHFNHMFFETAPLPTSNDNQDQSISCAKLASA